MTGLLSSTGKSEAAITYDEYGKVEHPETVKTSGNIFGYTGHVYEETTGLYYAKARYYDAENGRFLSVDHYQGNTQEPASLNPYIYVQNNPHKYIDPSGHVAIEFVAKLGVGSLFDMGMQLVANYFFNSKTKGNFKASFDAINWGQVVISGVQNLFDFKNKALTAAITGLGDVIVNWMKQGKKYSCEKALKDFAFGFLSDLAARYVCKYGKKAVAKGMDKMGVNHVRIKKLTGVDLSGGRKVTKVSNQHRKVQKVTVGACFVAGTLIKTIDGNKKIEDIRSGDYVLAQNPETGETAYKEVIETFVRETDTIVHVRAGGTEIETTREHPFWVEGRGFVRAENLKVGDRLRLASGKEAAIEEVWEEALDEEISVYNFEVADFHTYFVSELGVLVHNTCKVTIPDRGFSTFRKLKAALGSPGKGKVWHHIVEQSQIKKSGFSAESVNNIRNVIAIPHGKGSVHAKISAFYSSIPASGFTNGMTVRQWLAGQSYQKQFDFGMKILRQYGNVVETANGYVFKPY